MLSTIVNKFNKRGKRQERTLLITSKALYNISRQNLITQAISWLSSSLSIKRRIDIAKITGITVSDLSGEFVIHVPDEYDYRYSSSERRDRILQMICRSYYSNVADRPLLFYFKVRIFCRSGFEKLNRIKLNSGCTPLPKTIRKKDRKRCLKAGAKALMRQE